jgi:hypothetical protein
VQLRQLLDTATFGYGNFWIMWNQIYDSSPSTDACRRDC